MSKNITQIAIVLVGIMVVALAWGISPVLTKPTNAEVTINRSDSPVFLTSALKIVNQGGQVRTIISLWDGQSPFLAVGEDHRIPQRSCTIDPKKVREFVLAETGYQLEWPTNVHSMTTSDMAYAQRKIKRDFKFPRTMKDIPMSVTSVFNGKKENDEHVFSMY